MKKTIISSLMSLSMLTDLVQAHQFTKTEIDVLSQKTLQENGYQTIMIKVSTPLLKNEKEMIYAHGIDSIVYAGEMQYFLYGNTTKLEVVLGSMSKIETISAINVQAKASSQLEGAESTLNALANGDLMRFNVLLLQEMDKESLVKYLEEQGIHATVYNVTESIKSAHIRIAASDYDKVKNLPLIQYLDGSHSVGVNAKQSRNLKSASYENIKPLWSDTYHLEGQGMRVAVVDGGYVRNTHKEFVDRGVSSVLLKGSGSDFADHATHVAGTIMANGVNNKAHGVASDATLYSYTFADKAFADIAVSIYTNDGVLISNHSYGYSEFTKLGEYDLEASKQDSAVSGNPFLNIFEAAGNDGEDSAYPAYGKIKGPGNSKNILTIGALNINASGVAKFSSNGPTKDGRIKPELCARGESVYSTGASSDDDYFWMSGTSMATPSATGVGVLVSQAYQKVSGGYDIRHDILKACMINAAVDKGRKGPDFDAGFGMIDGKATVDMVNSLSSTKPLIYADNISHSASKRLNFKMPKSGKFKATISWIDEEANPSSASALVNDIDMWLENKAGKKFYPYTLNAANPTALAVKTKLNHVDNNEQIEVQDLPQGDYTLVIKGERIISDRQEFALASNVSISADSHLATLQPSKLHNFAKVIQGAIY